MSMQSLHGPGGFSPAQQLPLRDSQTPKGELPFADLIRGLVQQADQQQIEAQNGVTQLVTGETDSIHDVVLTASRADLAFRLMMEIRNRLIASYQEVMRMQV